MVELYNIGLGVTLVGHFWRKGSKVLNDYSVPFRFLSVPLFVPDLDGGKQPVEGEYTCIRVYVNALTTETCNRKRKRRWVETGREEGHLQTPPVHIR